jgi:Tol biopolymer transport system component
VQVVYASDRGGAEDLYLRRAGGSTFRLTAHTATGGQPTWSPDGRTIAFVHDDEIWLTGVDGTSQRRLPVKSTTLASRPAWSPDGTRIAFVGDHRIHVASPDGSNERVIGPEIDGGDALAWTPSGKLTFALTTAASCGIYVIGADGTGRRAVVTGKDLCDTHTFAWSRDGALLAFGGTNPARKNRYALAIVRSDGTNVRRLPGTGFVDRYSSIAWSPDSTTLVYGEGAETVYQALYTIHADGTGRAKLTRTDRDTDPAWSADGATIAYGHADGIRLMDASGEHVRALGSPGSAGDPAWSPAGNRIAYTERSGGGNRVALIPAQGGSATLVVGNAEDPAWAPDGRRVAFVRVDADGVHAIWSVGLDGKGARQMTYGGAEPSWSRAGAIAFTDTLGPDQPGGGADVAIAVVRADGRGRRIVAGPGDDYGTPAWSPNGRSLAWVHGDAVWVSDANGKHATRVVRDAYDPAWTPDGRALVVVRRGAIYTLELSSRRLTRLVAGRSASSPAVR